MSYIDMGKMTLSISSGTGNPLVLTPLTGWAALGSTQNGLAFDIRISDTSGNWEIRTGCTWTNSSNTLSAGTFSSSNTGSALAWGIGAFVNIELVSLRISNFALSGVNSDITTLNGLNDGITTPSSITFSTAGSTDAIAKMHWDNTFGALTYGIDSNVNNLIGAQTWINAYNSTGSTLTPGQVVYTNGAQGNTISVALAQANAENTSSTVVGVVAENISSGGTGVVITSGIIWKLNTSSLTTGAQIYLSPSIPGGITGTEPSAPNHRVPLGFVTRSHTTVGQLYINVELGQELAENHDVLITTPASGQSLTYNGTYWINAKVNYTDLNGAPSTYPWSSITSTPSTLSGYGITTSDTLIPLNSGNVQLTTPVTGQNLTYNGTKWVNTTPPVSSSIDTFANTFYGGL